MHYIGMNMYNIDIFENEAKRLGVQRAIAFASLKHLKWGSTILLARYIGNSEKTNAKRSGEAEVFGYMTLSGLSHNLPLDILNKLYDKLDIISIGTDTKRISRACGAYTSGGTAMIRNTLEDLISKIEDLRDKCEIDNLNKYKWFITGSYCSLKPFIIKPVTFARGIITVSINSLHMHEQQTDKAKLLWLYDYKRREYMPDMMKKHLSEEGKSYSKYFK